MVKVTKTVIVSVDKCMNCPNYITEMGGGSCEKTGRYVDAHNIDKYCPYKRGV